LTKKYKLLLYNNKREVHMDLGKKIRRERKNIGLTLKELAKEVGFNNYQTLSAIEKGERSVTVSELDKIAKALGLNISYLMEEREAEKEKVLWRKCSDKARCKIYENELNLFCENYKRLAELIDQKYEKFIPSNPAELQKEIYGSDYEFAVELAKEYRALLQLGRYPGNNLIDALQEKNILIFCRDLGNFGSAASLVGDFGAAILLNKNDMPWRRTFDISHELFHLITWNVYKRENVYDDERGKSAPEKYADTFASFLLLPEESLREEIEKRIKNKKIELIDVIDVASKFKVSLQALSWRLQNLRIFSPKEMQRLREHPNISKFNKLREHREPNIPSLPVNYVAQAIKTYQKGRISKLRLADYLNVKYGQLESFLHDYSFPDIEDFDFVSIST
jgi:Zn-dependent peptidase ImmA (M78 family)/DNA-binding XRE family transcriptional regulator